ncbi:MAG: cysteine synthase A [Eubacterium sp.]|nr:cysteine synthase A [Eubacterium sp.]
MIKIYNNVAELVGKTPLVQCKNLEKQFDLKARLLAKLEYLNPAGSIKDRVAKNIVEEAERSGRLQPGATIVEPTSGNTGIGLALMCAIKGYRLILTMPETMSEERRNILKAYGAELVLTPGSEGMSGAVKKANELVEEIEGSILAGQFENPDNPAAHKKTTGPEIWMDTEGRVDIVVAGVGTGGTITGISEYLKSMNPDIQIIAVEPETSAVLSGGKPGPHAIQGIGAGFIPKVLDTNSYDRVITADNEVGIKMSRLLAKNEGILVGISAGSAMHVAVELAKLDENKDKTIVVILPDSGDRYYSTPIFKE